jgi:hypothetical protein
VKCLSFGNKVEAITTSTMHTRARIEPPSCEVHDGSSKIRLPVDLQTFGWTAVGPDELSTIAAILGHLYAQFIFKQSLSN